MAKRPVSAMGNKRPVSEYARRAAALGGNPRYKVSSTKILIYQCVNISSSSNGVLIV